MVLLLVPGCPPGVIGKARPEEPTAARALARPGEGCDAASDYGKPLVVDLAAADRGDLEIAMKEGVVVVRYDCKRLEIVPDCHAEGSYGFMGFSAKEEVVRLADQDELNANLPVSAGVLGAKLGGEFERGTTLDIALMMIGKRRTTRKATLRGELVEDRRGACAKATHFVRGATLGAFAMTTGAKAEARAAAEIFGIPHLGKIGTGAESKSSRDVQSKDGELDACKGSSPDAETPPALCSALLRLELTVIDPGGADRLRLTPDDGNLADACPAGRVAVGGKCTRPTAEAPHLCKPGDYDDCAKQCDAGDAGSCGRVGYYHEKGEHFPRDLAKAASLYQKSCDKGWTVGCASLGSLHVRGEGVAKDVDKGVGLIQRACDSGDARFCSFLGAAFYTGNMVPKDPARAVRLLRLGCNGGSDDGCFLLGESYRRGVGGLPKDAARARSSYAKGCDGGDGLSCFGLAVALEEGIGGPKEVGKAQALFKRLCDAGLKDACKSVR